MPLMMPFAYATFYAVPLVLVGALLDKFPALRGWKAYVAMYIAAFAWDLVQESWATSPDNKLWV